MRHRTPLVFGIALLIANIAGCTATRHTGNDLQLLSAGQNGSSALAAAPSSQGRKGQALGSTSGPGKRDSFNFSHPRVDSFVNRFQTDLRQFFTNALSRSGRYVPRMSSILEKQGLPQELAYLPLIESGFRPHAVSPAGAVGPWQFIPGTGRRYGLRIDRYVDERRDPVKSTQAAARYLRDLHDMFGDWHLSIAAYNTGEGNISRILERGQAGDFWEMSDQGVLYRETEDYVPEFLAALQIAESPEQYGFEPPPLEAPLRYDLVKVMRPLPLTTIARLSGASPSEIEELNPALHRGVIPPNGYAVRVPKGTKEECEIALANLPVTPPARTRRSRHTRGVKNHRRASGRQGAHHATAHSAPRLRATTHHAGAAMVASRRHSHARLVD